MNKACGNEFVPGDIVRSRPPTRRRAKRSPLSSSLAVIYSPAMVVQLRYWPAGLDKKTAGVRKRQQLFGHSKELGSELNRVEQPTPVATRRAPMRRGKTILSFVYGQNWHSVASEEKINN